MSACENGLPHIGATIFNPRMNYNMNNANWLKASIPGLKTQDAPKRIALSNPDSKHSVQKLSFYRANILFSCIQAETRGLFDLDLNHHSQKKSWLTYASCG